MLTILSPAKTLDMETPVPHKLSSLPNHLAKSQEIAAALKTFSPDQLSALMGISNKLAQLNSDRYARWQTPYIKEEAKQAVFAFRGEVYTGIDIDTFDKDDIHYTQDHLRILSGLYGLLRPMDLILAYRLEMGTKIKVGRFDNLYSFWGNLITDSIQAELNAQNDTTLINLASNEYNKSIDKKRLKARIITPVFKDYHNGQYKIITVYAKKARGLMTRFIMKNRISKGDELKHFDLEGYYYSDPLSNGDQFVFTRG